MLPTFYQIAARNISAFTNYSKMLVWLLQHQKQVKIERLAAVTFTNTTEQPAKTF